MANWLLFIKKKKDISIFFFFRRSIIFCFAYSVLVLYSQKNIVNNYSFEEFIDCPTSPTQVEKALPWYKPSWGDADYFNSCCLGCDISVPKNNNGYQYANTGNAYMGLYVFINSPPFANDYREYIQSPLLETLEQNKTYCVQFHISLADTCKYAINRIGLLFSNNAIICPGCVVLNYIPQIESPSSNFIFNTTGWTKISGLYIANGNEKYITLGNFRDDANTDTISVKFNTTQKNSYYYIDDVSIVALTPVNAGTDDTICQGDSLLLGGTPVFAAEYLWQPATGLDNSNSPNPKASPAQTTTYIVQQTQCSSITHDTVTVYVKNCPLPPDTTKPPEPFILPTLLLQDEYFSISGLPPGSRLWVYDIAGRLVYHSLHYRQTLHNSELATGIYLVRLQNPDGTLYRSKLMIVK